MNLLGMQQRREGKVYSEWRLQELHALTQRRDEVYHQLSERRAALEGLLQAETSCSSSDSVLCLRDAVQAAQRRIGIMRASLERRRRDIELRQALIADLRSRQDARRKKFTPRSEFMIPFDMYLRHTSKYDKTLSALHPFRKLRGIAHSLAEERKKLCQDILSIFRFRPVTVGGGTELVADFAEDDGGNTSVAAGMMVSILAHLARVLDTPLPFPIAMGTVVSSPCLHNGVETYETGCAPYARILHRYKRVILPVTGDPTLSSQALLMENLRFLTGVPAGVGSDAVHMLATLVSSPHIGKEFVGPLQRSHPSSPSLSGSCSPSSASYRRSVIEQSVTEGGEWTLLDQL